MCILNVGKNYFKIIRFHHIHPADIIYYIYFWTTVALTKVPNKIKSWQYYKYGMCEHMRERNYNFVVRRIHNILKYCKRVKNVWCLFRSFDTLYIISRSDFYFCYNKYTY